MFFLMEKKNHCSSLLLSLFFYKLLQLDGNAFQLQKN